MEWKTIRKYKAKGKRDVGRPMKKYGIKNIKFVKLCRRNRQIAYTLQ